MSNLLARYNTIFRGSRALRPPNIADLSCWLNGNTYESEGVVYYTNTKGNDIPVVSGFDLDAILDFSVLGDVRLDKSNATYWGSSLDDYFYYNPIRPFDAKLKDYHYFYIQNQMASDNNFIFLEAQATTNTSNDISNIDSLLIYSTEQTGNNINTLMKIIGIQDTFYSDVLQISDLLNFNYQTFTGDGNTGFAVTSDALSTYEAGTADELDLEKGKEYLVEFDFDQSLGTVPVIQFSKNFGGSNKSNNPIVVVGSNSHIMIPTDTFTGILKFLSFFVAVDFAVSNLSIKQKFENYYSAWSYPFSGMEYLAIGNSLTIVDKYQPIVGAKLDLIVTTHAIGGAGIVDMILGKETLPPLAASDLIGIDVVTFFGGINDRGTEDGLITDIYPAQDTLAGRYNFAFNSIYSLANDANNSSLRLIVIIPHLVGKYEYIDADGTDEYPIGSGRSLKTQVDMLISICELRSIKMVDLYYNSGIDSTTWDIYTASNSATNQYTYVGEFADVPSLPVGVLDDAARVVGVENAYIYDGADWILGSVPYPWNTDQVHLSDANGYPLVANMITSLFRSIL